ncbi:hypothetical protein PICMEDRAFT_15468 [Pichia membranifaciens NRRL Y-2026]|uniref:Uncharacterized protein n=1 Tax=Pichia membranifaciens NRRL Y-2026 TaxID=763406 RepID=A0A1E3NN62_9ASCO|nr:hypothetical protein PICMEDRAFT_15468 [Pichia membranifaciens NRRL Y-2026]ODQ47535.1 hypothetical protein PICMEDRAFT_15468 [Pichia membranifaciens NRRL Y-2026]
MSQKLDDISMYGKRVVAYDDNVVSTFSTLDMLLLSPENTIFKLYLIMPEKQRCYNNDYPSFAPGCLTCTLAGPITVVLRRLLLPRSSHKLWKLIIVNC